MTDVNCRLLYGADATRPILPMPRFDDHVNQSKYIYRQEVTSYVDGRLLTRLSVPGWRLVQPIQVLLETETSGDYIVSDALFGIYGVGGTRQAAVQDYEISLIEYYEILAAHATPDDEPTSALFERLREYVDQIRA